MSYTVHSNKVSLSTRLNYSSFQTDFGIKHNLEYMNLLNNASSCTVYLGVDLAIRVILLSSVNLDAFNFRLS